MVNSLQVYLLSFCMLSSNLGSCHPRAGCADRHKTWPKKRAIVIYCVCAVSICNTVYMAFV